MEEGRVKENETKYVERYDYWMCEKCGDKLPAILPGTCGVIWCHGCDRIVIENLPLDAGVIR